MLPGRLTRWKGQRVLIEALRAPATRGELHCVIVGSGGARYRARARARRSRATAPAGHCPHPRRLPRHAAAYMLADVVVSASTEPEGFGRVIVEAQAMGRPVIATAHGGAARDGAAGRDRLARAAGRCRRARRGARRGARSRRRGARLALAGAPSPISAPTSRRAHDDAHARGLRGAVSQQATAPVAASAAQACASAAAIRKHPARRPSANASSSSSSARSAISCRRWGRRRRSARITATPRSRCSPPRPSPSWRRAAPYFDRVWIDERPGLGHPRRCCACARGCARPASPASTICRPRDRSSLYFHLMGPGGGRNGRASRAAPRIRMPIPARDLHAHARPPGRAAAHGRHRRRAAARSLLGQDATSARFGLPARFLLLVPGGARAPAGKALAGRALRRRSRSARRARRRRRSWSAARPRRRSARRSPRRAPGALDLTGRTSFGDIVGAGRARRFTRSATTPGRCI